jgi:hypothetical protein
MLDVGYRMLDVGCWMLYLCYTYKAGVYKDTTCRITWRIGGAYEW